MSSVPSQLASFEVDILPPPSINRASFLGTLWFGATFAIASVTARLIIRKKMLKRLYTEDYLIIAALCLHVSSAILWTILSDNVYLTFNSDAVRDVPDIQPFLDKLSLSLHANFANYVIVWTALWCVKLSLMAFFRGLGRKIKTQQYLWAGVLVFIIASYFVCIGVLDYRCLTSTGYDIIAVCADQRTVDYEYIGAKITTVLDIVTDASIVAVTGNIVWRVQIPRSDKLVLGVICSLTILLIGVAIARIAGPRDQTWMLVSSYVEVTIAIFLACVASFRAWYIQHKCSQPEQISSPATTIIKLAELPADHEYL